MTTNTPASVSAGQLATLSNLKQGLQNVTQAVRAPGGEPIMRLGRDGIWVYGADNVEVEEGSKWAINPLSIRFGLVCWKVIPEGSKQKPELFGKHTRGMNQTPLDPTALQATDSEGNPVDHQKHPWVEFIGCDMKCISGEDTGTQSPYEPSSTGGVRAMRDLMAKLDKQIDKDPTHVVPVILLESDSYDHKTWGKTYIPVLNIVDWASMDDPNNVAQPEPETVKEPEPDTAQAGQAGAPRRRRGAPAQDDLTKAASQPANTNSQAEQAPAAQTGERRRRRG